ncbi:DUF4367 domain-containing protein [Pseudoflavonifractor capillosus]|uniref:DUF4367 domain-containing protein n=1 Tax=Pseudoflavonifractor capillosus TaxID=106588 RepID=UPI001958BDDF|nr:DUF4367 domain-containing protein [Pseudoflavonifractor capillosus]MBM6682063.1 DUF4367 domain-containing protein [Pseudoflavonifractor capillosus]
MTDHERLREQYEDALFALLMEGVAESEGEEALRLNEELKKDPNAEVPKDVQKRCEKTIRAAFAQKQLRATGRTAARWLTRVAVVAALGGVMFTAAFALSEDVRVATLNALIQVMDDRTQISFEGNQMEDHRSSSGTVPGLKYQYNIALEWLPEGYSLVSGWTIKDGASDHAVYVNSEDSEIMIDIKPYNSSLIYTFDTEGTTSKEIEIQNHKATLYTKNENMLKQIQLSMPQIWSDLTVFWIDDSRQGVYCISATNQTEADMIKLANGIHWNG